MEPTPQPETTKNVLISNPRTILFKSSVVLAAMLFLIPVFRFFTLPKPLKLTARGLEQTRTSSHKALRSELIRIEEEKGYTLQLSEKILPLNDPLAVRLQELLNHHETEALIRQSEAIGRDYIEFLNKNGIYYNYENTYIGNFFDFLNEYPLHVEELNKSLSFTGTLAPILLDLVVKKAVLPENGLFPEAAHPEQLYGLLSLQFRFELSRGDRMKALRIFDSMLDISWLCLNSEQPNFYVLQHSVLDLKNALYLQTWTRPELHRLSTKLNAFLDNGLSYSWIIKQHRTHILRTFEQVRLNGVRLFFAEPPPETALLDAIREWNSGEFKKIFAGVIRDFFYDIDADELMSLRMLRNLLNSEPIPYYKYPNAPLPVNTPFRISNSNNAVLKQLIFQFSDTLASLESIEFVLAHILDRPYARNNTLNPLTGRPYSFTIDENALVIFPEIPFRTSNETPSLFKEGFKIPDFKRNGEKQ